MKHVPHLSFIRILKQMSIDCDLLLHFYRHGRREEVLHALESYDRRHGPHPILLALRRYLEGKIAAGRGG